VRQLDLRSSDIDMSATSQLTVSAIRQHFESYISYTAANTPDVRSKHVAPPKSGAETAAARPRKQPPETRPKPKTAAAAAAHAVNATEPCSSTASETPTIVEEAREGDKHDDHPCDDRSLQRQARRVSSKRRSREETDAIVSTRASVKPNVVSRWSSASSLLQSGAADDVRLAINSARQKPVLHRIVGMKLAGEHLPERIREAAAAAEAADDDDIDTTSQCELQASRQRSEKNRLQPTSTASLTAAASDTCCQSSSDASTDDDGPEVPAPADVVPEPPTPTPDADVGQTVQLLEPNPPPGEQTVERSPTHDETATENEEDESESRQVVGQLQRLQARRPISLYPQDAEQLASMVDIDSEPVATVGDVRVPPATVGDDQTSSDRQASGAPPDALATTTFNLTSVKHPDVAPSRHSYLVIREFVGENFSFLDDLDEDVCAKTSPADVVDERNASVASGGPSDSAAAPEHAAATAQLCSTDGPNDEVEQTTQTTVTRQRPNSALRKSIVLPNGEIVEIIGREFTFLDDYDEQTAVSDRCCSPVAQVTMQ